MNAHATVALLEQGRNVQNSTPPGGAGLPGGVRVTLGNFPTRLSRLPKVGAMLGVDLWMKHEFEADAFGSGNKVRKLEFLIPEIIRGGYTGIIGDGTTQSNSAMALALYAPRFDLSADLILSGSTARHGNYLDILHSGARVKLLAEWSLDRLFRVRQEIQAAAAAEGRRLYVVPTGATNVTTVSAGVDLAAELAAQEKETGVSFDYVILPTASGGTQVGLELGRLIHGRPWNLIAIGVANDAAFFADTVRSLARASASGALIEELEDNLTYQVYMGALGAGYGVPLPGAFDDIRRIRTRFGLLLDSVYTHKAFVGMRQLIADGKIPRGSSVAFIHTGGLNERFVDTEG
jgi:1-aminocyclopropane-1-carboxylate deaminase/D-cysteine desulfhydrase-like pyridoxal-dependent ACC family enzyme